MTLEAIQRLVAGASAGLSPEDVSVVTVARPKSPEGTQADVALLGSISVSRGSLRTLQGVLGGAILCAMVFAALFVATYLRLSRERGMRAG
jgi:type III secretory pathway lipoprotein EscJ